MAADFPSFQVRGLLKLAVHDHVVKTKTLGLGRDAMLVLVVPSEAFFESAEYVPSETERRQCTYRMTSATHAIRHAASLLTIATELIRQGNGLGNISRVGADLYPWLTDACAMLNEAQKKVHGFAGRWLPSLLRINLQLSHGSAAGADVDATIIRKAACSLVLSCVEVLECLESIIMDGSGPAVNMLLCSALVRVAEICTHHQPVLRLTCSHLVPTLEKLSLSGNVMIMGTDIWVSKT